MSGSSWRQHRMDPILPKRPATCCRCGRQFKTEINPEIRGEFGVLIRGPRQVHRLCLSCRTDGQQNERRKLRKGEDAHEAG